MCVCLLEGDKIAKGRMHVAETHTKGCAPKGKNRRKPSHCEVARRRRLHSKTLQRPTKKRFGRKTPVQKTNIQLYVPVGCSLKVPPTLMRLSHAYQCGRKMDIALSVT